MKAIVGDGTPPTKLMDLGCPPPTRASKIEPIQTGPFAGYYSVDMSPLGPAFQYCLWPPQNCRKAALDQEHEHVVEHWVKAPLNE